MHRAQVMTRQAGLIWTAANIATTVGSCMSHQLHKAFTAMIICHCRNAAELHVEQHYCEATIAYTATLT